MPPQYYDYNANMIGIKEEPNGDIKYNAPNLSIYIDQNEDASFLLADENASYPPSV